LHVCVQRNESVIYPTELDAFVDKRMLFKVEVSAGNLHRSWRSYTVKKLTQDDDIINRFLTLHCLNVSLMQYYEFVCITYKVFQHNLFTTSLNGLLADGWWGP